MIRLVTLLLCWVAASPLTLVAAPERWAADIAKLTQHDEAQKIPRDAVVFVGSSSIVLWNSLTADFPGIPVIQRGFGGSELADSVHYADRIVLPYRPRAVVLYAGENDITAGKTPETVAADFEAFRTKIHVALPNAVIYYLSMKLSPSRAKVKASMLRANELIAAACAQGRNCIYVDVNGPMLDVAGEPRPELFQTDMLHMRPEGYAIWKKVLSPLLQP